VGRDGADVPADRPAIEKADFCVTLTKRWVDMTWKKVKKRREKCASNGRARRQARRSPSRSRDMHTTF
jgi:hypothetical protein